jgi:protein-L-isoaspartate O-methyltransferase
VITQVDDGQPSGLDGTGVLSTSSASMPTVVAVMLRALDVHDGHNVLEIGTGTGYEAGYRGITVVTADGAQGLSPRAPYDRVLSTASCQQVPYPWVAQTVPGGKVLTPWRNAYYPAVADRRARRHRHRSHRGLHLVHAAA